MVRKESVPIRVPVPLRLMAGVAAAALTVAACSGSDPTATPPPPAATSTPEPQPTVALVSIWAPIESVRIDVAESFPVQYFLNVVSGLQNSCVQCEGLDVSRDGATIEAILTNLQPAPGSDIACAEVYRTMAHSVNLGSDFIAGTEYTVHVNEVTERFTAEGASPTPPAGQPAEVEYVPAPTESVQVSTLLGDSPTYMLQVISVLPNLCASSDGLSVDLQGSVFDVTITNVQPVPEAPVQCTQVYRTMQNSVQLPELEPGTEYTFRVNDMTVRFRTPPPTPAPEPSPTSAGTPAATAEPPQPGGPAEGISVRESISIEVRDPDGTVVATVVSGG